MARALSKSVSFMERGGEDAGLAGDDPSRQAWPAVAEGAADDVDLPVTQTPVAPDILPPVRPKAAVPYRHHGSGAAALPVTSSASSSPSTASRAWPHFVPRIELEVDLKSVHERLDALFKRIELADMRDAAMNQQIATLLGRCGSDLVTQSQLAETEDRIEAELAGRRREVLEGLEELRRKAEDVKDFGSVREEHSRRLAALDGTVEQALKDLARLRQDHDAGEAHSALTFASRTLLEESISGLRGDILANRQMLETAKAERQDFRSQQAQAREEREALRGQHEAMVNEIMEDIKLVRRLSNDFVEFKRSCETELALRSDVEMIREQLANVIPRVESRAADCLDMHQELQHEKELRQQSIGEIDTRFNKIHRTLAEMADADADQDVIKERVNEQRDGLAQLSAREEEHWNEVMKRLQGSQEAQSTQLDELQTCLGQLQAVVQQHLRDFDGLTGQLREECTSMSLQHLDRAIGLKQSLDKLEYHHRELETAMKQQALEVHVLTAATAPAQPAH